MADQRYIGPFWVERQKRTDSENYELKRIGEGTLCRGDDIVFMNKLADILNEHEHDKDVHR